MARSARKYKTLLRNPNERKHREHRSKKNRRPLNKDTEALVRQRKRKSERQILRELDKEIKDICG